MGVKGSGRLIKYKTETERRQAYLESKRKYNNAHREKRGEERAERIIRSKIDGTYKNKPVVVTLDWRK